MSDTDTDTDTDTDPVPEDLREGRWVRWFGPLTPARLVVLLIAVGFFGAASGYAFRDAESQATSAVDVGFLRDMSVHHSQAVVIAKTALYGELPDSVALYADEVITQQQYELGLMQATLYRLNEDPTGDGTAMGWMGMPVPESQMPGLASAEELARLERLDGDEAAGLFFALMSRHHLGGLHMSDAAAESAEDPWIRELAARMADGQRKEIDEYSAAIDRLGITLPEGFTETPQVSIPPTSSGSSRRWDPLWLALVAAGAAVAGGAIVLRRARAAREDAR